MRMPVLILATLCLCASAGAASPEDNDTLAQAHRMQLEFREGRTEVAKPLVKMLEEATAKSPGNARLWEALGHANMSLQGSMFAGPPDMPTLIAVGERAREAYARSLALDPKRPLVRASHGMSQMVVSQLKGDGAGVAAGINEMDAAVRQAPRSTAVRLTRGFTIVHLPPAVRNTPALLEDFRFILETAPGGRAEDVLRVLLGDVHAESGDFAAARAEYQQVTGASAFAVEQATQRLQAGKVTPQAIALVRQGTGSRCAMCHAPGTDN